MKILQWLYFFQARFLQIINKNHMAINAFNMALKVNPDFGLANGCLGHLYASLGQPRLAEHYFNEALRINPNDPVIYYNLGYIYETQKKFEEAIAVFQKSVELNPRTTAPGTAWGFVTPR